MSLINKMLQDLDARGSQSGASLQPEIKPVLAAERQLPVKQIAIGAAVLVVALAISAWFWIRKPGPAAQIATGTPPASATVTAPMIPLPASKAGGQAAPEAPKASTVQASAPKAAPAEAATPAAASPGAAAVASEAKVAQRATAPAKVKPAKADAPSLATSVAAPAASGGREMTSAQRAESTYRNAMARLDEGRVSAAMDGLEQTLKLNPSHDGARQSLASLLIEAGRPDDAMRQLEQGLAADPAQPSMAMLLARMQIERGQSGVPTLMRTLPSAAGNGDYHAFLGGALQRDGRHREAVEQYAAALRTNPEHGVWLMGAGISLQAEQRNAEALTAFERAKASGMLNASLMVFVDRKLQQLAP
jgi:MSHA biogenesis protein MshN